MLPDRSERSITARQAVLYCAALLPVSLLPSVFGFAGPIYFGAARWFSGSFFGYCWEFSRSLTHTLGAEARDGVGLVPARRTSPAGRRSRGALTAIEGFERAAGRCLRAAPVAAACFAADDYAANTSGTAGRGPDRRRGSHLVDAPAARCAQPAPRLAVRARPSSRSPIAMARRLAARPRGLAVDRLLHLHPLRRGLSVDHRADEGLGQALPGRVPSRAGVDHRRPRIRHARGAGGLRDETRCRLLYGQPLALPDRPAGSRPAADSAGLPSGARAGATPQEPILHSTRLMLVDRYGSSRNVRVRRSAVHGSADRRPLLAARRIARGSNVRCPFVAHRECLSERREHGVASRRIR